EVVAAVLADVDAGVRRGLGTLGVRAADRREAVEDGVGVRGRDRDDALEQKRCGPVVGAGGQLVCPETAARRPWVAHSDLLTLKAAAQRGPPGLGGTGGVGRWPT